MHLLYDLIMETARAREPYRQHKGRFLVDIGNGTDPKKHDYCVIIQETGEAIVLVMHQTHIAAFDGTDFVNKKFTYPLNYKHYDSSEDAYNKFMRWIGKMVKKDERGRYYTRTRYHSYDLKLDEAFDIEELNKIADIIKEGM